MLAMIGDAEEPVARGGVEGAGVGGVEIDGGDVGVVEAYVAPGAGLREQAAGREFCADHVFFRGDAAGVEGVLGGGGGRQKGREGKNADHRPTFFMARWMASKTRASTPGAKGPGWP